MSRTHKDKPWKLRNPESDFDYTHYPSTHPRWSWYCRLQRPGVLTKKKRSHREYHGMPTPMWWIREFMNQPQRTAGKQWERDVVKWSVDDLIDCDTPSVSRKPHLYYW